MYTSIMVPLDGSSFGEQALPMAVAIARQANATLHLVHVKPSVPPPVLAKLETAPARGDETPERYLDAVTARVARALGDSVSFTTLEAELLDVVYGSPPRSLVADALADYVEEHGIDLVVMTTHGRGGLSRAWLGSVADSLVRHSTVPVLLIRPQEDDEGEVEFDDAPALRDILIPLDGSEASEAIIRYATGLGELSDARYTLLRVIAPALFIDNPYVAVPATVDEAMLTRLREDAHAELIRVAEELRTRGLHVSTKTVLDPAPARAILEYAREHDMDLITMSTRGLGGWSRTLLGSVADKVVRAADRPVLVHRDGPVVEDEETVAAGGAASTRNGTR